MPVGAEHAAMEVQNAVVVKLTPAIGSADKTVSEAAAKNGRAASRTSGASTSTSTRITTANKVVSNPGRAGGKTFKAEAKGKAAGGASGAPTAAEIGGAARPGRVRGGQLSRPNHSHGGDLKPPRRKIDIVKNVAGMSGVARNVVETSGAVKSVAETNDGNIVAETTAVTAAVLASVGRAAMIDALIGMIAVSPRSAIEEVTIGAGMTAYGAMKGATVATSKPIVKRVS